MLVFIAIALEVLNKMQVTLLELLFKNVREQTDLILSTPCFSESSYISAYSAVADGASLLETGSIYCLSS